MNEVLKDKTKAELIQMVRSLKGSLELSKASQERFRILHRHNQQTLKSLQRQIIHALDHPYAKDHRKKGERSISMKNRKVEKK